MNKLKNTFVLRKPKTGDAEALLKFKNDATNMALLGGFSTGYSSKDIEGWIENHKSRSDEVLWIIADEKDDSCLGHVGLYQIDYRIRSAEFGILLGDRSRWGKGIGRQVMRTVIEYGFRQLNLNRISLTVLAHNERAIRMYEAIGFMREGLLRQAQYKDGRYMDLVCYALLRDEYKG